MTKGLDLNVQIQHWINRRAHAGDVIERWSIAQGERTILTVESELEAHRRVKALGWTVTETIELGDITG